MLRFVDDIALITINKKRVGDIKEIKKDAKMFWRIWPEDKLEKIKVMICPKKKKNIIETQTKNLSMGQPFKIGRQL